MKQILLVLSIMVWSMAAFAEGAQYTMRVDGLACPFCAYGIEKKLTAIDGVQEVDFDLDKGLIIVIGNDSLNLTDQQMATLFEDAGFTFRSMEKSDTGETAAADGQ